VLEKLIREIAERLDADKVPYMLIGGQAVLVYGRPRLTRDIDITLGIDVDDFSLVERKCNELRLKILPEKPEDFARETRVLPVEEPKSRTRVDFIFSFSEYERQALNRVKRIEIDDYPVRFASCEDTIIHKMVAGRSVDEEDVKSILVKHRASLDLKYVERWLSEFGRSSEHSGVWQRFTRILDSV
jgi:predicted nucleotidyltransferase